MATKFILGYLERLALGKQCCAPLFFPFKIKSKFILEKLEVDSFCECSAVKASADCEKKEELPGGLPLAQVLQVGLSLAFPLLFRPHCSQGSPLIRAVSPNG